MNLATPPPKVEPAVAAAAPETEAALASAPAEASEAAIAEPPKPVEPAETVDNPYKHAPPSAIKTLLNTPKSNLSCASLRQTGVEFEGRAGVCRGAPRKPFFKLLCPPLFDQRDFVTFSEIARYVLIKDGFCFVYLEETDLNPLYAFDLNEVYPVMEDPNNLDLYSMTVNPVNNTNQSRSDLVTILFKYPNKKKPFEKQAYQFTFETKADVEIASRFLEAAERSARASKPITAHATVYNPKNDLKEAKK